MGSIIMKDYLKEVFDWYQNTLNTVDGKNRKDAGSLHEELAVMLINLVDKTVDIRRNQFITVSSKSGKYSTNIEADVALYREDELMAVVECKTYLDMSMAKRAGNDFRAFERENPNVKCCVLTAQYSMGENARGYINEEYGYDIFVVNKEKQRNQKYPLFKTKTGLDRTEVFRFLSFIAQAVPEDMENN